ncbi:NUDIX hydrolase [Roseovarius sp. D0-M9]|uniref:NUDIX hydrolase n=1 Tax=Roseovarius sp. D0-M9 TaxID=3127117 RepID=UPI00300FE60B
MSNALRKLWEEYVRPILQRPKRLQVAALCYRTSKGGKKVLLVTSRGTGRWIIPKGWPMDGKNAPEAAMQEAWEEAGVREGQIDGKAIGCYAYNKELKTGLRVPVETLVYKVEVSETRDDFPEAGERERRWVTPEQASNMVREPQLQALFREM